MKRFTSFRWIGGLSFASLLSFAAAFWPESVPAAAARVPRIEVGGLSFTRNSSPLSEQAIGLARRFLATKVRIEGRDFRLEKTREELGVRVSVPRLLRLLETATAPRSRLLVEFARSKKRVLSLPMPAVLDERVGFRALCQLKQDYDKKPVDAHVDMDTREVRPEQYGRRLKVYETLAALDQSFRSGATRVEVVRERIPPRLFARVLQGVDFSTVLGVFETRFANDEQHADRAFNLTVAAKKLNGHIILPGETFSFNQAVGERSEVAGFRTAKVIAQGELVDGLGGGTCQIASTLHAAAFFAGLEILTRRPHSRPSYYIKLGLDATVVYPNIDLRLRNPFDFPVVLRFDVKRGIARSEILGHHRDLSVTFIRHIDEITPFSERTEEDPTLPRGIKVLRQRGIDGYKVRRYRVLRKGAIAWRETGVDDYPPTTQIWRVGTGSQEDTGTEVPRDDDHPEYLADEYLWLTQGPEVRTPSGFVELKRAGRSGTPRAGGPSATTR